MFETLTDKLQRAFEIVRKAQDAAPDQKRPDPAIRVSIATDVSAVPQPDSEPEVLEEQDQVQ